MRFKVIDDDKIKSLIKSKEVLAKQIVEISEGIEKEEEKRNKLVLKLQRYNDKIIPLSKEYQNLDELVEFEKYSRMYLDSEELRLEVYDEVEEFMTFIRDRNEKDAKLKEDGTESTNKD